MMNLDELRKLVDFMKENGLCELEYSEKHTSVKLRLATPVISPFGHHGSRPMNRDEPIETDYDLTDDEDMDIDVDELKASAKKAARKAAQKAADGMETVAAYVKSKLSEDETEEEEEDEESFEAFSKEEETPEETVKPEESSRLNRETLRHAKEAVRNTVKAGAVLGKAGAKRGKERLVNLFRADVPEAEEGPDEFEFPTEEENDKE